MAKRLALLIGNNEFEHTEDFPKLRTPSIDARDLAEVLQKFGHFEISGILINERSDVIKSAIEDFFGQTELGDLVLLYYSGHGYRDLTQNYYLTAHNTNSKKADTTAIEESFLRNAMSKSNSRHRVIVLDCCFSGSFISGQKGGSEEIPIERLRGKAEFILTSSGKVQPSFEEPENYKHSLFTEWLIEGISSGMADGDLDGKVGVIELWEYAAQRVSQIRSEQTPMIHNDQIGSPVVIAEVAKDVRRRRKLDKSYDQAHQLFEDEDYQGVIDIFAEIRGEDENYPDPDGLLDASIQRLMIKKSRENLFKLKLNARIALSVGDQRQARNILTNLLAHFPQDLEAKGMLNELDHQIPIEEERSDLTPALFSEVKNSSVVPVPAEEKRALPDIQPTLKEQKLQKRISTLKEITRSAMSNKEWRVARARSSELLALAPDDSEAKKWLEKANRQIATEEKRTTLSPGLLDAINNPSSNVRIGAVAELGQLLSGGNPRQVELALEQLHALADNDDSKRVMLAARNLLSKHLQQPWQEKLTEIQDAIPSVAKISAPSGLRMPSLTPDKTASPILKPASILDTFDVSTPDWEEGNYTDEYIDGTRKVINGKFRWEFTAKKSVHIRFTRTGLIASNFYAAVDLNLISGPDQAGIGLVVRKNSSSDFYFLCFKNNQIGLFLQLNNTWSTVFAWQSSTAIHPGKVNHLAMVAVKDCFWLFVNNILIGQARDSKLSEGSSGLGFELANKGETGICEFDNFELRPILDGFTDTFDSNVNNWNLGNFSNDYFRSVHSIIDGKFRLETTALNGFFGWVAPPTKVPLTSDFYAAVDVRLVSGPDNAQMGLALIISDTDRYIIFLENNYISMKHQSQGAWVDILAWTANPAIHSGQTNRLEVLYFKDQFWLFVNMTLVGNAKYSLQSEVKIQLGMGLHNKGEKSTFEFDNFEVRPIQR